MNTYANMLERAVVINSLKSEDIFSAIAELTDALVAAGSLPESKRDEANNGFVQTACKANKRAKSHYSHKHE